MPNKKSKQIDEDLELAFLTISEAVSSGHKFTDAEMDLGIQLSVKCLPEGERQWFEEIAKMNGVPLWQALWGQWRRCYEQGTSQSPILDPGWEKGEFSDLSERECPECHTMFMPANPGMIFCSTPCGAAEYIRGLPKDIQPESPPPEKQETFKLEDVRRGA